MSGPVPDNMGNLSLPAMVQTGVIMNALPDSGCIEIVKGRGQGWQTRASVKRWLDRSRAVTGVLAALARGWAGVFVCRVGG